MNAAGLASKLDSFDHALKSLQAKLFFVQEVKQKSVGNIQTEYLSNYQLFELTRKEQRVSGGGLMIGVDRDLQALQVREGDDEVECLTVVVSVPGTDIRAVCGYGPQGRDTAAHKTLFWEYLEKEVDTASKSDQVLIIQLDSNSHAGSHLIPNDPNPQNENGKFLQRFMDKNPGLRIVNSLPICKGLITRQRNTTLRKEMAVLDLFIVCEKALVYIHSMKVDEGGEYQLSNFHGIKRGHKTTHGDHNIVTLNCKFQSAQATPQRTELFNFKNREGQQLFKELTTNTNKLSNCFENNLPFLKQTKNWFKQLNSFFYQCFTKIRSRKRKQKVSEVERLLEMRKKLRRNTQEETVRDNQERIKQIESEIQKLTNWKDRESIWQKFQQVADSDNSTSTQAMWKWKKQLFPKIKQCPPMGVKNKKGEVETKSAQVKEIYKEEYKHRLRARPLIPELLDIEEVQNKLFQIRLKVTRNVTTPPWTMKELNKVLSSLKSGKARDPSGLSCDIFKKTICGMDLKISLLKLLNRTKETQEIPCFFTNSNISSIWKKKGNILDLQFHRGLFLVSIFKTIIMKLIYLRNYETIDTNMSESNVGGRKGRNCRDHVFVVNGVIQDALSSKTAKPLDIFICDYRTMFDGMDVKTTLNDLYDNGVKDDTLSLIYRLYETNHISIKTPLGHTERRPVDREIITQGDSLGPILASSTVDSFGKECFEKEKHLFWYRNKTPVSPLAMLDDVLALSSCGPESTQIQDFLNIKSGCKKLQYSTEKTYRMHIGRRRPEYKCEQSFVDSWVVDRSSLTDKYSGAVKVKFTNTIKYLGERISSDGTNTENVAARTGRGYGTVKEICHMLDTMCLGPFMYQKAIILRNSMLIGTLLTCCEAWYNVSEVELGHIEQVDKSLWCNLLEVAKTVPYDLICLDLGLEPLRYVIIKRRLFYLQHILKQKETSLVKKFLKTQILCPKKKDWIKTVLSNLEHLGIDLSIADIEEMPRQTYKKLIKKRIEECAFNYLIEKRNKRNGKGIDNIFTSLKIQNYLSTEDIDIQNDERKYIFQIRSQMLFKMKTNFRNMYEDTVCEGCRKEESSAKHTLQCSSLLGQNELVTYLPHYENIHGEDENLQVYIARVLKDNIRRLPPY